MRHEDFVCPVCGEMVPGNAVACPECGADEQTGWSDRVMYDDLGLEDPDDFDYARFLERELRIPRRRTTREWLWGITAALVLLLLVWLLVVGASPGAVPATNWAREPRPRRTAAARGDGVRPGGLGMRAYGVVFLSVFLAELGDKTQLATLLFATNPAMSRLRVFVAAAAALVASSAVAVAFGAQLGKWLPPQHLTTLAGLGFVAIGIWLLVFRG